MIWINVGRKHISPGVEDMKDIVRWPRSHVDAL